ncbi:hypothetical protein COLU111180_04330 [Cohnella lubricantis]|uniref:Uncharacterized protein n=1 Tax=Cohnella lubricantis TaxID=2163172 RepID=A0A841TBS7_9BACL|nr:hypothetical protein [Cohnella lubricantis]MBB6676467.1 hypothetical protein [Cohnella lubricantis]MBP2117083.1 hypothetical protein [Cohnella lubricantis]
MGVQVIQQNSSSAAETRALDTVGTCAYIFCGRPIHFTERVIQQGDQLFCCEDHFVRENGARIVKAGTGEWTI